MTVAELIIELRKFDQSLSVQNVIVNSHGTANISEVTKVESIGGGELFKMEEIVFIVSETNN